MSEALHKSAMAIYSRLEAAQKEIQELRKALAAHQAQQAEPPFLLDGARFKVSSAGTSGYIGGLPSELNGRWVALVAADDDCHLKHTSPQPAHVQGWQLARVSDGDIRVYGPDKETWLIRKDCGEGFYDFIHRYFDAAIGPAPQQGDKT